MASDIVTSNSEEGTGLRGSPSSPFHVVGIGASAGGLEALRVLFGLMPPDTGLAFVVIQHLSPDYKSLMGELLAKHTQMPVRSIEAGMPVERNGIYLIPPRVNVTLQGGRFVLSAKEPPQAHAMNLPIDIFFRSLAEEQGELGVGIILSGTGSDGMRGVRAIKEGGGLVLVQDEATAKFDGMPRSAIATGIVDYVVPPEAMPDILINYAQFMSSNKMRQAPAAPTDDEAMDALLSVLKRHTGVDFSLYKPNTIRRRVARRMGVNQIATVGDYARFVSDTRREVSMLCKDLLIGVTKFFRDGEAFEALRERVLPEIVSRATPQDPIRVWVPGCATGEEAYSIAMLLAEEIEAQRRTVDVKVFATDIDKDSIAFASAGIYPESIAADLSSERLQKFFVRKNDTFHVSRSLRQSVLFAHQNLFKDPPFTRLDLVSCRNLLIYVEPVLQRRALSLFHFALKPDGFLFLGSSESLGELGDHYRAIDGKWKIFRSLAVARPAIGDQLAFAAPRVAGIRTWHAEHRGQPTDEGLAIEKVYEDVTKEFLPVCLLLNENLELVHVIGDAKAFLQIPPGVVTLNALHLLPKPLAAVVSAAIHKAQRSGSEVFYSDVGLPASPDEERRAVRIRVRPVDVTRSDRRFILVMLSSASARSTRSVEDLDVGEQDTQRISDLQQELYYARENLQATIEELQTSNEELQATNEELLSANEELQSTNEELQSLNEELYTVNAEHQAKLEQLVQMTQDMDNLLMSTHIGTLFLDDNLQIRKFTPAVTRQVNVLQRDIGRPIEHISLNFNDEGFVDDIRRVLNGGEPIQRPISARDGAHYLLRILPYIARDQNAPRGAVVTFVDVSEVRLAEQRMQSIVNSLAQHVAMVDAEGTILMVNAAWADFGPQQADGLGGRPQVGENYGEYCGGLPGPMAEVGRKVAHAIQDVARNSTSRFSIDYACENPSPRRFLLTIAPLRAEGGGAIVSHVEI